MARFHRRSQIENLLWDLFLKWMGLFGPFLSCVHCFLHLPTFLYTPGSEQESGAWKYAGARGARGRGLQGERVRG